MRSSLRRLMIGCGFSLLVGLACPTSFTAESNTRRPRIPPQRIATPFPIFATIWREERSGPFDVVIQEAGELNVPECAYRKFNLEQCNRDTVDAYAAEVRRLGLESVDLPAGTPADTILRLVRACPTIIDLGVGECELEEGAVERFSLPFSRLRRLSLGAWHGMKDLSWLAGLDSLEEIELHSCPDLTAVGALRMLPRLRRLTVVECDSISDIATLASLEQLEGFDFVPGEKRQDVSFVWSLHNLRTLSVSTRQEAFKLPALAQLSKLRMLDLGFCSNVVGVDTLGQLPELESLVLPGRADVVSALPRMPRLRHLRCMERERHERPPLTNLAFLSRLDNLKSLFLGSSHELVDIAGVSQARDLRVLDLRDCKKVTNFSSISALTKLQRLNLSGNSHLKSLSFLAGLGELQVLDLADCGALDDVSALSGATKLEFLNLHGCRRVADMAPVLRTKGLRMLDASSCNLPDLSRWPPHPAIQSAWLYFGQSLGSPCFFPDDIDPTYVDWRESGAFGLGVGPDVSLPAELNGLRSLEVRGYRGVIDLGDLANKSGLHSLRVIECNELTFPSALIGGKDLRSLRLFRCNKVRDLGGLSGAKQLRILEIDACHGLVNVSALAGLESLRLLRLDGTGALSGLSALRALTHLRWLELKQVPGLVDLSVLSGQRELETLSLCLEDLKDVSALSGLQNLRFVSIEGSKVPGEQIRDLRAKLPNCAIYFEASE